MDYDDADEDEIFHTDTHLRGILRISNVTLNPSFTSTDFTSDDTVAKISMPVCRAICTATWPTPPAAAWIRID